MTEFAPSALLSALFAALTFLVAAADVVIVRRAAPEGGANRWTAIAVCAAAAWMALHAGIAESGILEGTSMPPPVLLYLVPTALIGIGVAFSPLGKRLAALPLAWLVGLQAFRIPLEIMLHALYDAGLLPVQMTWSGYNFDVLTGLTAVALGIALWNAKPPLWVVWAWNVGGTALLLTVVTIALLSAPLPIRQFLNEPAVVLPFHAPFNWIVNVHVWTALVSHLVLFRALWSRRAKP